MVRRWVKGKLFSELMILRNPREKEKTQAHPTTISNTE